MGVRQQLKAEQRKNAVFVANYTRTLTALRRGTINKVIDNMYGSADTLADNAASLVEEDYLPNFYKQLYTGVGSYWARRQYNSLLGLKQDVRDAVWNIQLQQWIDANTGKLIVSVQGTLKKWVRKVVQDYVEIAMEEGIGLEALTQEAKKVLSNAYTGYAEWKTRQIVSQEVLSAYSVSNKIGADSTGLEYVKQWIHSGSGKPHANHVPLNGVTIGKNDLFQVGQYTARYPRDVSLGAEESVNCLCAVAYRAK
jgi:hypothetical protein